MQQLPSPLLRYSRQIILKKIGPSGQRRIREASVAIIGCGALGSYSAELLARAGIGRLKLVDRDIVELDSLLASHSPVILSRPLSSIVT